MDYVRKLDEEGARNVHGPSNELQSTELKPDDCTPAPQPDHTDGVDAGFHQDDAYIKRSKDGTCPYEIRPTPQEHLTKPCPPADDQENLLKRLGQGDGN